MRIMSDSVVCYFCEEEIHKSLPPPDQLDLLVNRGASLQPTWRHVLTGNVACECVATPTNLTVWIPDQIVD